MGQTHNIQNRLVNQWTYVDTLGKFEILKNQHNQLAQKHIVKADPKIDQNDYLTAYHQRYLPNKPIVNAYDAQFSQKGKTMCQNTSTITVYTQFIPHRLSDVKTLNHGQGMYVLSEALAGFSQLYGRVGPFQVHQDLIGFNQQGQVRTWYNPNFADNSVDNDRIILMSTVNPYDFDRKFTQNQQYDMVQDTINAVAKYTRFHPNFLYQAQQLKKVGFSQARRILSNQISRKAYYVPDHLFLGDRNDIIKKSGIQIKNKHVFNPNKQRKGQGYPYFMQGQQGQSGQVHYLQGQAPYNNYYGYDNDSQSSESCDVQFNGEGQGYYNLNGQNYRVVASKQIEGDNVNQQAIIDEVLRNRSYNQPQYSYNPNYAQVRSTAQLHQNVYDDYSETSTQYRRKHPKYQQGHIVINDASQHHRSRNQLLYADQINQYQQPPQKQTVRVFSVQDGRLVEQNHSGNPNYNYNEPQYIPVRSQYQQQINQAVNQPPINSSYMAQGRYNPIGSHTVQNSGVYTVPLNSSQNVGYNGVQNAPHYVSGSNESISHRHKIFEPYTSPHQQMVREGSHISEQRVF